MYIEPYHLITPNSFNDILAIVYRICPTHLRTMMNTIKGDLYAKQANTISMEAKIYYQCNYKTFHVLRIVIKTVLG